MSTPRSHRSIEGHRSRPPPSREVEYKLIHDIVNDICSSIKKYAQKYFTKKDIEYGACLGCFKDVVKTWRTDLNEFSSWKDFMERVGENNIDKNVRNKEAFTDLIHICERSKEFEVMIPHVREKLVNCVKEHVYKYCHSFAEETGGVDAGVVVDYEQQIRNYKKDIEKMINAINADILRYSDVKSSFDRFVGEGGHIGKLMENICVQIVEIAHEVKKWISDDSSFPDKLQQEILFNNGYKDTVQEDVFKLHQRKDSLERSLERRAKVRKRLEKHYKAHKIEKRKRKESLQTVQLKIERLEFQIDQRTESLEYTREALTSRRTPRQEVEMRTKVAKHLKEIDKLHDWLTVAKRQRSRLEKGLKDVSDRTYELKVELVTNRHELEEMQNSHEGMELELRSLNERLDSLDRKTAVMKHIRVLKVSPETLRKLYRRRREFYQQGNIYSFLYVLQTELDQCQYLLVCLKF